nr:integrase, catalytic region, zinc finger, CCHC-type, peptidase aspartic, catalytic [Tanacetum cinerariifolium]
MDKRLRDLMMMILVKQTEECDMMLYMVKTDMLMLVAEIEVGDKTTDDVDKLAYSADVVRSRQVLVLMTDFASWQQRIRLYWRGKENGMNILKSNDEGPFQIRIAQETLTEGTEGAPYLGPERPRVYSDLSPEEKDRYNADIRETNILLQGLPKDIYTLINHYTDAKDGGGAAGYGGAQNRVGNSNPDVVDASLREWGGIGEEQLLFLAGGQDNAIDEDALTAQTMFMANLSSADAVYNEAGPSYDSDILSEDNTVPGVQSYVSSILNDAYMMIYNDMYEPATSRNTAVDNSLTTELATYEEQVKLYERRARFELTKREQKIDEQLRIVITDRNFKDETLKKELHSVKLQVV